MTTRFERELRGDYGTFWQKDAQKRIADMELKVVRGDLVVDWDGAAYWKRNGAYIPDECAEILSYTGVKFSRQVTAEKRRVQTEATLSAYRARQQEVSAEESYEMEAAFGKGTTVVDVITGRKIRI